MFVTVVGRKVQQVADARLEAVVELLEFEAAASEFLVQVDQQADIAVGLLGPEIFMRLAMAVVGVDPVVLTGLVAQHAWSLKPRDDTFVDSGRFAERPPHLRFNFNLQGAGIDILGGAPGADFSCHLCAGGASMVIDP